MKSIRRCRVLAFLSALSFSLIGAAAQPAEVDATRFPAPVLHPRSLHDRVFDIWRNPGRFTKNPDIVELPSGRLMLVYSDTEKHFSIEDQHLIILVSDDQGKTWRKHATVDSHDMRKGEERLVTPRLSILKDGRLIVLIDQDDWGHFHEDQPSGIMAYWSTDNGDTWSEPQFMPRVKGFEPDHVMDLPDGSLGFVAHVMLGESQEFAQVLYVSDDQGQHWKKRATVAHDGFHRFCEGAIVELKGKGKTPELACVLRENHSAGEPSFVVFSKDCGKTWGKPEMLPFAFHRPYAKQLPDGRTLVTGRNMLGGLGTFGWVGDLKKEAGRYEIGGPAAPAAMQLTADALVIENKPDHAARFSFLPPESSKSEIVFSARMKVEGPTGVPVAFLSLNRVQSFRGPVMLKIASDGLWITDNVLDEKKAMDMTQYREIAIRLRRGLLQVYVDDKIAFSAPVFWESYALKDFLSNEPTQRTQFGQLGDKGKSHWQRVTYRVFNPAQPVFVWQWLVKDGKWPDQYQRDRLIQIHSNPIGPKHRPDHGYTSWLQLKDGRILLVDYTNRGDAPGKSHLVAVYINPEDLSDKPSGEKQVLKSQ
ncbi:sialidase family protein [Oleiharenicola lentus]|uniref:sialidase family protein n=1 Tax=Oleiharenicola lentus TaxID=2508720 RepID=UPI003F66E4DD